MIVWQDATRESLGAVAGDSVAVLPVGAIEQHGPHLPTSTDTAIVSVVARRACARAGESVDVLLLPTLPFGSSDHHLQFGATLSLSATTLSGVLADLLRSVAAAGVRRAIVVNGHGGNVELCGAAIKRAAHEHGLLVAAVSYWDLVGAGPDERLPGHAGAFETAVMLAIEPAAVRMDRARPSPAASEPSPPHPAVAVEDRAAWARIDGFTDDPRQADPARGAAAIDEAAAALAEVIVALGRR